MPYFSMSKTFLVYPYTVDDKGLLQLDEFLLLLDRSNVGEIIKNEVQKELKSTGRPGYNPYKLFAVILYSFSKGIYSLRKIEEYCKYDLRYLLIMDGDKPSYVTISKFLNNVVVKHINEVFSLITKAILDFGKLNIDDAFLDGTKIEANANKYKFVWKPSKPKKKLFENVKKLLMNYFKLSDKKETFTSFELANFISKLVERIEEKGINAAEIRKGKGIKNPQIVKDYLQLNNMMVKLLEFEEKEEICGPERNSYFKTDHDATAMCLKSDYYSGLGSNMHAAYNLQIIVSKGIVLTFYVSQDRNDFYTLIPTLSRFCRDFGYFPKRLCADSGYGSLDNYEFLEKNKIGNFVKYNEWKKFVNGEYSPLFYLVGDDLYCLNNKKAECLSNYNNRHPRRKNYKLYVIKECKYCRKKDECMKDLKNKKVNERVFEVSSKLYKYKQEANDNLLSAKGIEMRVNRSAQVEGAFGVIKQDMNFIRLKRRGLENVSLEVMMVLLGYNINKFFKMIDGTFKSNYWVAPENLCNEVPKIKKKARNKKKEKSVNQKNKESYKYKRTTKKTVRNLVVS